MRIPSLGPLESAMTERIQEFLRNRRQDGLDTEPCLVVDLEVVRDNYQTFAKALPDSRVFYAVKANPAPEVLSLLAAASAEHGQSIAMVTHDPIAASFADRVLFLGDGKLVADKPRQSAEAISAYMLRAEDAAVLS